MRAPERKAVVTPGMTAGFISVVARDANSGMHPAARRNMLILYGTVMEFVGSSRYARGPVDKLDNIFSTTPWENLGPLRLDANRSKCRG